MKMGDYPDRRRRGAATPTARKPVMTGGNTPPSRGISATAPGMTISKAPMRTGGNTPASRATPAPRKPMPAAMKAASRTLDSLGKRTKKPRKGY